MNFKYWFTLFSSALSSRTLESTLPLSVSDDEPKSFVESSCHSLRCDCLAITSHADIIDNGLTLCIYGGQ